ncbi:MAG TPA: hypothetical protein VFO25_12630 [Candidatus Eremiobacteraceae bacterium]|nr:hypothetical protein [Candidatus Eremiobacteraceae bacterium]
MRMFVMAIVMALVGASSLAGACSESKPTVVHGTSAMKVVKGMVGGPGAPLPLNPAPSPWPNFYGPTQYDFDRTHLSPKLRQKVMSIVQRIPSRERLYARWLPSQGDVIVFEVRPDQIRSDGRGYSPSKVINEKNMYVDPTDGNVFAGPP